MAATAAVVTSTLPTSGSASFTKSGFGTPTAALIIASRANTTNNPQNYAQASIGIWDGASQHCIGYNAKEGGTASETYRESSDSNILLLREGPSNLLTYTVSSTTDGVSISITGGTTGVARYCTVILFSGTTNEDVGTIDAGTGSAVDVTAPGFKPDLVFFLSIGASPADRNLSNAIFGFGVAHNDSSDTVTQGCVLLNTDDGEAATDSHRYFSQTNCIGQVYNGTASWVAAASGFDGSGFTITPDTSTSNDIIFYLALELSDPDDAWVGVFNAATSTGTDAQTGVGFQPDLLGLLCAEVTTAGSVADGLTGMFGFSDGTTTGTYVQHDEDGAGNPVCYSEHDGSNILFIQDDDGTQDALASLDSLDADGFTLDYSDAASSAWKILGFAIGDSSAGGGTTYEDSIGLAVSPGLAQSNQATLEAASSLAASLSAATSSSATLNDALTLAAQAGLAQSAGLSIEASLTLATEAGAGLTPPGSVYEPAAALGIAGGIASAPSLVIDGAAVLAVQAAQEAAGGGIIEDAVSLAATAGIASAGALVVPASVILNPTLGVSSAAALVIPGDITLGVETSAESSATGTFGGAINLDVSALVANAANVDMESSATFAALLSQEGSLGSVFNEALALAAQAGLAGENQVAFNAEVLFPVQSGQTVFTTQIAEGALILPVQVGTAISAGMQIDTAITVAALLNLTGSSLLNGDLGVVLRLTLGGTIPTRDTLTGSVPTRDTLSGAVPTRDALGGDFEQ